MPHEYYVRSGGKVFGPIDSVTLLAWAREGNVTPESEVRQSPTGPWVKAARVGGLFPTPAARPPVMPRPAKLPPVLPRAVPPPATPPGPASAIRNYRPGVTPPHTPSTITYQPGVAPPHPPRSVVQPPPPEKKHIVVVNESPFDYDDEEPVRTRRGRRRYGPDPHATAAGWAAALSILCSVAGLGLAFTPVYTFANIVIGFGCLCSFVGLGMSFLAAEGRRQSPAMKNLAALVVSWVFGFIAVYLASKRMMNDALNMEPPDIQGIIEKIESQSKSKNNPKTR